MKTTLRADVELWEIDVFAEVALWQRRPELARLCAAVPEGGALDAAIIDAALPGLSEAARRNVIRHLGYLRLVDGDGALTAEGGRCAAKGEAPAWELGAYRFLVAVHPLFERHVLGFKRLAGNGQERDFDGLQGLPSWFAAEQRRFWHSVFNDEKFIISKLPSERADPRCRLRELPPGRLSWSVDLGTGENAWTLAGEVREADAPRPFSTPPRALRPDRVEVTSLFEGWEVRWDPREERVRMAYDGGARAGHDTFLRTLAYPEVRAGVGGTFADVRVEEVPVGPSDVAEARRWALALLLPRIAEADAYLPRARWDAAWGDVLEGTPLAGIAGAAPEPTALPGTTPARVRWLAAAASDLAVD